MFLRSARGDTAINCSCGLVWFAHSQVGLNLHTGCHHLFLDASVWSGLPGLKMQFILKTQIKNELVNAFPFLGINNFVF
jgi:hypothetical protein